MMTGEQSARRVLIIGTIWPYHSGGARVPGLAKDVPECGWEPVVLTQPLPADVALPYRVATVGEDTVREQLASCRGLEGTFAFGPVSCLQRVHRVSSPC